MRGKTEARGARPSSDDDGSILKLSVLAMAMRRLNSEQQRRHRLKKREPLVDSARKALAMKEAAAAPDHPAFNSRHARKGMRSKASTRTEDLIRPMERGRLRKASAVAQARRDSKQGR